MFDKNHTDNTLSRFLFQAVIVGLVLLGRVGADASKGMAIGELHSWYSSAGAEREVGRRGEISDQQDGLRWPAQYQWQDTQVAKALWIGTTDYYDTLANFTFDYKVVHVGPRVLEEMAEIMPQELKLVGRYHHPQVFVDGIPASDLSYDMDVVDEIDPTLPADRVLVNRVNTAIGVTLLTFMTDATTRMGINNNCLAGLEIWNTRTNLNNLTSKLMPKDYAFGRWMGRRHL